MAGRLFPLGVPAAFRSLLSAGLVVGGGGSRGGDLREGGEMKAGASSGGLGDFRALDLCFEGAGVGGVVFPPTV